MFSRKQNYFKKISDTLPKIIGKDLKKANFVEISILQNWTDIVGEKIAKYSWPEKIIFSKSNNDLNGKVFLKVKRGWAMEVEYKNQEIIEKLNQFFGYNAVTKLNIIQDFEDNVKKNKKEKNVDKTHKKNFSENIKNIKQIKLRKALKMLDKTLFE